MEISSIQSYRLGQFSIPNAKDAQLKAFQSVEGSLHSLAQAQSRGYDDPSAETEVSTFLTTINSNLGSGGLSPQELGKGVAIVENLNQAIRTGDQPDIEKVNLLSMR